MKVEILNTVKRDPLFPRLSWSDSMVHGGASIRGPRAQTAIKKVREKIVAGEYGFEDVSCFCGSCDDILISGIDRYGLYYPMVICNKCGLMRVNPRMNRESYIKFYSYEYRNVYGEGDEQIDKLFKYRMNQSKRKYSYLMNYVNLPVNAVVFEIGCNFGTMLLPFAEKEYDVYGCDYGGKHIEYGREKTGLKNLFIGGLEKLRETGKKANLVILNHVFEHFLDLEMELRTIREIMKPDGFIFIAVPGTFWWIENICGGNIMGLLQNAHTYQFTLSSLTYVMECCGFKLIYGNEEIKSIFRISSIFREKMMVPDGEFEKVIVYLKAIERKYLLKSYLIKPLEIFGLKGMIKNALQRIKHNRYE